MAGLRFAWDAAKAAANLRKHGVSFDEARAVFADPLALTIPDPDHGADDEWREVTIGMSGRLRLVTVSHTAPDGSIRIISARRASRAEGRQYHGT